MEQYNKALCDNNINNLEIIGSTIGSEICSNCLNVFFNRFGSLAAANVEILFYFNQYTGGSSFLDSIGKRVKDGLSLSPKQYEATLKTFRSGNFIFSKGNSDLDSLYGK
jgi:hypothetical protein